MPAGERGGKPRGAWYDRQLDRAKAGRSRPRRSTPEQKRALDIAKKARYRLRLGMTPRGAAAPKPAPLSPIVELERHPLVDQAIDLLRPYERVELGSDFDAIARDLVGEYVVAALEGGDPVAALVAERARYRHDRAALVFGTAIVDGLAR